MSSCLPLGKETFLSFKGGQESHGVGGGCWSPPPGRKCGLRVGASVLSFTLIDGSEDSRADLDLSLMASCSGSPQGSRTPASGSLALEHLEESASWCGCGWAPLAYPSSPHTGVSWDPQGCPRSATWICGARPGPRRPHPALRGLTQPRARIQGWPGPWEPDSISL